MAETINERGGLIGTLKTDPLRNFRYLVNMQPYWTDDTSVHQKPDLASMEFGFTSVSGLSIATEAIPYREGGMNTTLHQLPGQTTFSPITLTRGVHLGNDRAWRWMRRLFSVTGGPGASTAAINFRATVDIYVLQHPVTRVFSGGYTGIDEEEGAATTEATSSENDAIGVGFRVYNAWIQSLAYSDLNAGDNAVLVEQMVLAHEGFNMLWPGGGTSAETLLNVNAGNADAKWQSAMAPNNK